MVILESRGMQSSLSDAAVGASAARAAAAGAYYNVLINLPQLEDAASAEGIRAEADDLLRRVFDLEAGLFGKVREKLLSPPPPPGDDS